MPRPGAETRGGRGEGRGRVGRGWGGASALVLEPAVDGLHVREHALPVGLAHRHHVVHVQEGVDARLLTGTAIVRYRKTSVPLIMIYFSKIRFYHLVL